MSAASAVALIQCSSNFRFVGPIRLFSRKQRPMLVLMAQFQTYAVFNYVLYDNAMLMSGQIIIIQQEIAIV